VAGGGDELLANDPAELNPGDDPESIAGPYPLGITDAAGRDVPIVTTAGNYRYLGRLDVRFDAEGEVSEVLADTSGPRRVIPAEQDGDQIAALGIADAVPSDPDLVTSVVDGLTACLDRFASTPDAASDVVLNVARGATDPFVLAVRSAETNGGDLVADAFTAAYDVNAATSGRPARGADALVVTVQNGGGIRQNAGDVLPQGGDTGTPISRLDTIDVLPFDDDLVVATGLAASDLRDVLELSCASLGGGGFLQVSALHHTCDLGEALGSRVRDVVVTGPDPGPGDDVTVVDAEGVVDASSRPISLVTNSFSAAGGDGYEILASLPSLKFVDAGGGQVFDERALRESLASFPPADGIARIPADDPRYASETGEGRIVIVGAVAAG
jgi:5'-nucleotidase